MSKVPHLLKGSALPDGEQRQLAEYASVHPKSALHRKGQHHDAAVLLVHGIGYQNHGETLAYFGKPVAHSVQTLLALNTDSVALSEENPAEEASARFRFARRSLAHAGVGHVGDLASAARVFSMAVYVQ